MFGILKKKKKYKTEEMGSSECMIENGGVILGKASLILRCSNELKLGDRAFPPSHTWTEQRRENDIQFNKMCIADAIYTLYTLHEDLAVYNQLYPKRPKLTAEAMARRYWESLTDEEKDEQREKMHVTKFGATMHDPDERIFYTLDDAIGVINMIAHGENENGAEYWCSRYVRELFALDEEIGRIKKSHSMGRKEIKEKIRRESAEIDAYNIHVYDRMRRFINDNGLDPSYVKSLEEKEPVIRDHEEVMEVKWN